MGVVQYAHDKSTKPRRIFLCCMLKFLAELSRTPVSEARTTPPLVFAVISTNGTKPIRVVHSLSFVSFDGRPNVVNFHMTRLRDFLVRELAAKSLELLNAMFAEKILADRFKNAPLFETRPVQVAENAPSVREQLCFAEFLDFMGDPFCPVDLWVMREDCHFDPDAIIT